MDTKSDTGHEVAGNTGPPLRNTPKFLGETSSP